MKYQDIIKQKLKFTIKLTQLEISFKTSIKFILYSNRNTIDRSNYIRKDL